MLWFRSVAMWGRTEAMAKGWPDKRIMPTIVLTAATVVALAFLIAGCGAVAKPATRAENLGNETSLQVAPDFTLVSLQGDPVALSKINARAIVLNFWASWCPPCRAEIPDFVEASKKFGNRGVVFLGINLGEDRATVEDFVRRHGISYAVVLDAEGEVGRAYGIVGIPTTLVLNGRKEQLFKKVGLMTMQELEKVISDALQE